MKKLLETRPTAAVAGAEYLAKVMAKWPAFGGRRTGGPAANPLPTAVTEGIERRASASQSRWAGLLTWQQTA